MSCKISVISMPMINEWVASLGEFKGLCKPGMPPFSGLNTTEALTKWLVVQMWVGILAAVVNFVLYLLQGSLPIVNLVIAIGIAFIGAWVSWFMLCKREPSCCCFCVVTIEGWKQMHLVYGLLMLLQAIMAILNSARMFMGVLNAGTTLDPMYLVYSGISLVITVLYNITWFFIGLSAVKIGGAKAGIELPEAVAKAGP